MSSEEEEDGEWGEVGSGEEESLSCHYYLYVAPLTLACVIGLQGPSV